MFVIFLSSSACSSSKNSKGGGWYQNRNVNQLDVKKQESVVYQSEENVFEHPIYLE
jgi:hypothetical protein